MRKSHNASAAMVNKVQEYAIRWTTLQYRATIWDTGCIASNDAYKELGCHHAPFVGNLATIVDIRRVIAWLVIHLTLEGIL